MNKENQGTIADIVADIRVSTDVDYITVGLLHAYLKSARTNLICMVYFLEYKIKQLKGGAK